MGEQWTWQMRTENILKYEFRCIQCINSEESRSKIWPSCIPTSAIRPRLSLSTCFKEFSPWTHAEWHLLGHLLLPKRTRSVASDSDSVRARVSPHRIILIHTEDQRSIYSDICRCTLICYAKMREDSWLKNNRLGSIWHGHSKPNIAKYRKVILYLSSPMHLEQIYAKVPP